MAEPHLISGSRIDDAHPLATEDQQMAALIAALGAIGGTVTANQGAVGAAAWLMHERPTRATAVLHRNAIAAADKIVDFVAGSVIIANVAGTQGFLLANTAHYMTAIPGNRWGPTVPAAIDSVTTTNDGVNTHVVACTIAQAAGAEWYDLFLSTDAAPKWVARITEAQRAAGGEILVLATYTAGASAGVINIGCLGTGIQTTNVVFAQNNAYRPDLGTITAIDCTGRKLLHVMVKLALTDLRSAPSLSLVPFYQNPLVAADWHMGVRLPMPLLNDLGQPLECVYALDVSGVAALKLLIGEIAGQGAAATVHVQAV